MTQPGILDRVKGMVAGAGAGATGGQPAASVAATNPYTAKAGGLKQALETLKQQQPNPDAYGGNAEDFQTDFMTWLELYTTAAATYGDMQAAEWGYITLPDGTMMPTGDLDPEQRAIFDQANEAKYQQTLNSLGLQQANLAADRAQAGFNNAMAITKTKMDVEDQRLRKSEGDVSRALGGLDESRNRAKVVSDTKLAAAPYATQGGKTSFSGQDLGSLIGEFAKFAGVDPSSSLLNYQGTSMVDPEADMARFDSLLGVGGGIPQSGDLMQYEIPGAPDLGGVPSLLGPSRPATSLLPSAPAAGAGVASKVGSSVMDLLQSLLGSKGSVRDSGLTREQHELFGGSGGAPSFTIPPNPRM